uniref:RING-type domain-containing protein n=1 Tax=Labrus bergylta TaxID=56723 RepID=A0A3Q3NF98_9LABR
GQIKGPKSGLNSPREMAQKGVQLDREAFSCSICLDLLKDPVTVPCGHSYCMNCIKSHWDKEDEKTIYSCPQCRQDFTPRPVLVKSTMLAVLMWPVISFDSPAYNVCSRHDEVMKMFCRTDQQSICYLCSVDEHKGHDTVSAAAERSEKIQDREKDVKLLQQEVEAINGSADKTVGNSEKIFTELIRLMEKRRSDVKISAEQGQMNVVWT